MEYLKTELLEATDLELRVFTGTELPAQYWEMRKEIYFDETGWLSDTTLQELYDGNLTTLCLYNKKTNEIVASTQLGEASQGEFQKFSGLTYKDLEGTYFMTRGMVAPEYRNQKVFTIMNYLTLQTARVKGAKVVFVYVDREGAPAQKILDYSPCENLPPRTVKGKDGKVVEFLPYVVDINKGMIRSFYKTPEKLRPFLADRGGLEACQTVNARLEKLLHTPFFTKIKNSEIEKEHYVAIMANMYQFVKMTTRILAKAMSLSEDKVLRNHFFHHLSGEIDHEVMIERDLAEMGIDTDYIIRHMRPSVETEQFMVIQESYLGHYGDPVRYLSVPFAIEGLSANINKDFMEGLWKCLERWGHTRPKRCTRFLSSHINTDGGDDGHWAKNQEIAHHCLKDEKVLQSFLNGLHLTMDSLERCYTSYVSFTAYSSIKPALSSSKFSTPRGKRKELPI